MARTKSDPIPDVSAAYHIWDDLFSYCIRMALSTEHGTSQEKEEALQRLLRGQRRALAERDAMWERALRRIPEVKVGE